MFEYFNFLNLKKEKPQKGKEDKSKGIVKWEVKGGANNFPQQLIQNVDNSPVASASLDVWIEYVTGDGLLVDGENGGGKLVGSKATLNDLHAKIAPDMALMEGVAIVVRYLPDGTKSEWLHLPFEETRIGIPDDNGNVSRIYHNPYYGHKEFEDKDTKWFYAYDPAIVKEQMTAHNTEFFDEKKGKPDPEYPGQVFWFSIEKPLARIYPKPFYYSSINWFQVDAQIQAFHERNIKNNFLLSVKIDMVGDPDAPAGEPEAPDADGTSTLDQGETVGEQFNRQMSSFAQEKGGVMVNWIKKAEEASKFEAFPTNSHHDLFIALQNITAEQISIGTKVPQVLVGIAQSGKLGTTQEIIDASIMMQARTKRRRNLLEKIYEDVFDIPDGTIKPIGIEMIPDYVWTSLTLEEQRGYIEENFSVDLIVKEQGQKSQTDDPAQAAAQAQLKGSVGGVTGILGIQQGVSSGTTTPESGIAVLQLIYGFTEEEARSLLGTPKEEDGS